jgi:hypothetical protein
MNGPVLTSSQFPNRRPPFGEFFDFEAEGGIAMPTDRLTAMKALKGKKTKGDVRGSLRRTKSPAFCPPNLPGWQTKFC